MIVSVIEEIFHLGSRPLDTECLGIFIALALQNLLRQSFLQIPNELYLAAKVDGTRASGMSQWKVFGTMVS